MKSGIYIIQNTANGKCYVGSTRNLTERWKQHLSLLKVGRHINPHLQASWNKHGETAFKFWVAEECAPERILEREQWWLDTFVFAPEFAGKRYNVAKSATSPMAGRKHTEESLRKMRNRRHSEATKQKMSAAKVGKGFTPEHRQALSEGRKGMRFTPEHKQHISSAKMGCQGPNLGKKFTDEHRAHLAEGHRGFVPTEETRKKLSEAIRKSWISRKAAKAAKELT